MSKKRVAAPVIDVQAVVQGAVALDRAGKAAEAFAAYSSVLDRAPENDALFNAAVRTALGSGQPAAAVDLLEKALVRAPDRDGWRNQLAVALMQADRLTDAEREAEDLLIRSPRDVSLLNLLGVIQKRRGRTAMAVATFIRATKIDPKSHSSFYNLGNTFLGSDDPAQAVEPLRTALDLKIDCSETARLLGQALTGAGHLGQALAAFDRAQNLDPKNRRVLTSRASALQLSGVSDAIVLVELQKAIDLEPDNLDHLRAKAVFLQRRSRFDEAAAVHAEVLERDHDDIDTLLRLGHLLGYSLRRYEEANTYLRRAVALRPDDPRCLSSLCKSLLDSRYGVEWEHVEEAGRLAHKLIEVSDDLTPLAANLSAVFLRLVDFDGMAKLGDRDELMAYWVDKLNVGSLHNQLGRVKTLEDRHNLVRWHREWGQKIEAIATRTPIRRPTPRKQANSKIRVGLMSSDLRNHPVAYFALPIIEHYDRDRFEIIVYSFYPSEEDQVQAEVRRKVSGYRAMLQATDQEIAQRIADDDLDILFELGGSTRYNRLDVLAYSAAPLQVSWLGYPHSAGLSTIDYVLVDPFIRPDDPELIIEKPFELAESWVVCGRLGFRDVPIDLATPEEKSGFVTFGTMNNPYKYTREIFGLWGRIMQMVPNSRFLFVRPEAGAPSFRANICREFSAYGIASDRILFEAVRGRHLPHYNRIDIALDTAPHTGGTTTCETLWMGVPVVTLVGPAFFERLSYSNLSNAGLGDLCAHTPDDYVNIAVALAGDPARRKALRSGLREQMRNSPLGDEKRWVRSFEAAIDRVVRQESRTLIT